MNKETMKLTMEQISDIVDQSFELGKSYAVQEIESTGANVCTYTTEHAWGKYIESKGGYTFHSGDAKKDLVVRVLQERILGAFRDKIQFD